MDTNEINKCLEKTKGFIGTFPCNMIPEPTSGQCYFVVNTSPWVEGKSKVQGSHWVAIVCKTEGKAIYFDSFGLPPLEKNIVRFLGTFCKRSYKYNTQSLQSPYSSVCGAYCIDFIQQIEAGASLRSYVSEFTSNPLDNDKIVITRTCQSLTQQSRLRSKLKTLLHSGN